MSLELLNSAQNHPALPGNHPEVCHPGHPAQLSFILCACLELPQCDKNESRGEYFGLLHFV